jgi:hypothetical protein
MAELGLQFLLRPSCDGFPTSAPWLRHRRAQWARRVSVVSGWASLWVDVASALGAVSAAGVEAFTASTPPPAPSSWRRARRLLGRGAGRTADGLDALIAVVGRVASELISFPQYHCGVAE